MANISLYKIFDKLHENMTRDEIVEVLYDLVELKINTNSFKRPISDIKLVIGERMAPAFFHDYPKSAFLHPFSIDNRIFLPESDLEDALQNDNVGKLIRTIGHELEHVYQMHNDIDDERNYNAYNYYKIPDTVLQFMSENFTPSAANIVSKYTYLMMNCYHDYLYFHSEIELGANVMGTLYYGYSLEHYAMRESNDSRREWLMKQTENIFMAQELQNEEVRIVEENIASIGLDLMHLGLLSTLYFADNSPEARYLIVANYDIARQLGLDEEFDKQFNIYYNNKYSPPSEEKQLENDTAMRLHLLDMMSHYDFDNSPLNDSEMTEYME